MYPSIEHAKAGSTVIRILPGNYKAAEGKKYKVIKRTFDTCYYICDTGLASSFNVNLWGWALVPELHNKRRTRESTN